MLSHDLNSFAPIGHFFCGQRFASTLALGLFWFLLTGQGAIGFVPGNLLTTVLTFGQGSYHTHILERALLRTAKRFFNDQLAARGGQPIMTPDDKLKANDMFKAAYGHNLSSKQFEANVKEMKAKIASVDADEKTKDNPKYHFDAERFPDANNLMISELGQIITLILHRNYPAARQTTGILFHTLQDFYSHSNWLEIHQYRNIQPIPINENLGKAGLPIGQMAGKDQPTCGDCNSDSCRLTNLLPEILNAGVLTSGYYSNQEGDDGNPVNKPLPQADGRGKCSHGGVLDNTRKDIKPRGGINKDSTQSFAAAHHEFHNNAATVAEEATFSYLLYIRRIVGDVNFGRYLSLAPEHSVSVVAKRRRSLSDAETEAKPESEAKPDAVVNETPSRKRHRSLVLDVVEHIKKDREDDGSSTRINLVDTNGDSVEIKSSADLEEYIAANDTSTNSTSQQVAETEAKEPGSRNRRSVNPTDDENISLKTVLTAVEDAEDGGDVLVLIGGGASGGGKLTDLQLEDTVAELARVKHVTLTFIEHNNNIQKTNQYSETLRRKRQSPAEAVEARLAKATGGQTIDASRGELDVLYNIKGAAKSNAVVLLKIDDVIARSRDVEFFVDWTVSELHVLLESSGELPLVNLLPPSGNQPSPTVDDVLEHVTGGSKRLLRVLHPISGKWTLKLTNSSAPWSLRVEATSAADFSFTMLRTSNDTHDISPDPAALELITEDVLAGERLTLIVTPSSGFLQKNCKPKFVALMDRTGTTMDILLLRASESKQEYYTDIVVPSRDFHVSLRGTCGKAKVDNLQRSHASPLSPTSFIVEPTVPLNLPVTLQPGEQRTLHFNLTNYSAKSRTLLGIRVSDRLGYAAAYPRVVDVPAGNHTLVPVGILVPETAEIGSTSTLEFVATSSGHIKRQKQAIMSRVELVIGPRLMVPPSCSVSRSDINQSCRDHVTSCNDAHWTVELIIETHSAGLGQVSFDNLGGHVTWNLSTPLASAKIKETGSKEAAVRAIGRGACCVRRSQITVFDKLGMRGTCVVTNELSESIDNDKISQSDHSKATTTTLGCITALSLTVSVALFAVMVFQRQRNLNAAKSTSNCT